MMGWNGTFYVTSAIVLFSAVIFIIFGSGNIFINQRKMLFLGQANGYFVNFEGILIFNRR